MNRQQNKNNRTIIIIFAMAIIPFAFAWYLSKNFDWAGEGTNNGELIIPPVTTDRSEFIGYDEFSIANMKELQGRWIIVNVIPNNECQDTCQQAMHKTKQLRLMMNKELIRIRRLVLVLADVNAELAAQWWKDDIRLLRSKPSPSLLEKLKKIRNSDIPDGMLFLMDPLGNLMMQYGPEFDPYKVKDDLRKLLRISQIG